MVSCTAAPPPAGTSQRRLKAPKNPPFQDETRRAQDSDEKETEEVVEPRETKSTLPQRQQSQGSDHPSDDEIGMAVELFQETQGGQRPFKAEI